LDDDRYEYKRTKFEEVKWTRQYLPLDRESRPKEEKKEELKPLREHLKYVFLDDNVTYPVIVSSSFADKQLEDLLDVLRKYKSAIGWSLDNVKGNSPSYCMHKIRLLDEAKGCIQNQQRVNHAIQKVIRKQILIWLDARIIYAISDSPHVSPLHVIAKKGA